MGTTCQAGVMRQVAMSRGTGHMLRAACQTAGDCIDDVYLFNSKLQEWEDYYNYHRPHGAFAGQTPYGRLRQKAQAPLT